MKSFPQAPYRVIILSFVLVSFVAALGTVPLPLVAVEAAEPVADKPPAESAPAKLSSAQEKILQALQQPARFEFFEKPLDTVLASMNNKHKSELQLDQKALRDAGIKSDAPVIFHVGDVNLNNALWLLCRQVGLAHVIRGDDLLITTPREAVRIIREGGINPDQVTLWTGNGKIFRALAEPTTLEFIETPVQDVMDYLADLHSIPIRLDGTALRKAKIGTNTPVTFGLHGVTLSSGLRLMLNEVGLTHVVGHEMLLITTPKEVDRLLQQGAFEPDDIRFSPGNKWIFPALAEKTQLEFIDTPLQDVADYLKDLHTTKIKVDHRAIEEAGLPYNPPVTKKLHGVTLHSALKEILGELGRAHVVQHEVILITTPEVSRRRLREGALAPADTKPAVPAFARKSVAAALKTAVTVECREKPLGELVDVLKQQSGVEIRIDDWELATVGLTRDDRYTIAVKDVPLQSVLKQLVGDVDLGYITEGGLIVITSRDARVKRGGQAPQIILTEILRMGADAERGQSDLGIRITGVSCARSPERFTDEMFEVLKNLPWLRKLDIARTKVTDNGLAQLASFPELDSLDLRSTAISDAGLAHLRNVPKLTRLSLSGDRITDTGLKHVAALGDLQFLKLYCPQVTDAGLKHVAALGELQSLDFACPQITDAGLKHVQGLSRLQELQIRGAQVTDAGFRFLADLKELEVLALRNTKVTGAGLEHLERHEHLRELSLAGPKVSSEKLTYVAGCRHLESLSRSGPGVTDEALKHVARLKHLAGGDRLRELNLIGTQVSDAGLVHLAGLTQLTTLDLSRTKITGVGLSHLRAPKLFGLKLSRSQVTDAGLAHLKKLTALRRLDLTDTQVTDEGLVHLRQWWRSVRAAEAAGEAGGSQFGIVIARNTKITRDAAKDMTKEFRKLRVFGVR